MWQMLVTFQNKLHEPLVAQIALDPLFISFVSFFAVDAGLIKLIA